MEIDGLTALVGLAVLIVGPGGAAWVAVKTGLNGVKGDVKEIKKDVRGLRDSVTQNLERIASLEGSQGD